jgi:hypothetical protein
MKTHWHSLLQYGVGVTTIIVVGLAGIALMVVVGGAVVLAKISAYIK